MTPEEKAQELVNKYYYYVGSVLEQKQCALIAVDEVIDILSVLPYGMEYLSHIDYWEGVKQEIEKL